MVLCLTAINAHGIYTWYRHFMKLILLPSCQQCYLPEIVLEVYFICYFILLQMSIYTYTYFGRNWLKNKLNISQSVALGVWWLTADKALVWAVTLNLILHNQTVYLGLPSINFVCKNPNQNVLLFYRVEICY